MTPTVRPEARAWQVVAALLAPPMVALMFPMVGLIARNDEYFGGDYGVGRWVYAAGAGYLGLGVVLYLLRAHRLARILLLGYLVSAPLAWLHTIAHGVSASLVITGAAVLILAVLVGYLRSRDLDTSIRALGIVGTILLVSLGMSVAKDAVDAGRARAAAAEPQQPVQTDDADEDLPNVYHLVLDEFQTDMFTAVLDAEARKDFAGFTLYPDATTPYGRTDMALASTFSLSDYDYDIPPLQYIRGAYAPGRSALRALESAGYASTGYLHSIAVYGRQSPFADLRRHRQAPGVYRPGYAALATSLWFFSHAPDALAKAVLPARHYEQLSSEVLLPDDVPAISVGGFRTFLRDEQHRPARGRYTYVHLVVPHFPNVLESDCSNTPGVETDVLAQTHCAVRLATQMIERLKALRRFDDSIVVIHGDHGSRYSVDADGGLVDVASQGAFSLPYSAGRARTLLLVKGPRAAGDELELSDRPAQISDVLPTVFDMAGISAPFSGDRASLVTRNFPARERRYYHFYDQDRERVVASPLHRYVLENGTMAVDRTIPLP